MSEITGEIFHFELRNKIDNNKLKLNDVSGKISSIEEHEKDVLQDSNSIKIQRDVDYETGEIFYSEKNYKKSDNKRDDDCVKRRNNIVTQEADNNKIELDCDYLIEEITYFERYDKDVLQDFINKNLQKEVDFETGEIFPLKTGKNVVVQAADNKRQNKNVLHDSENNKIQMKNDYLAVAQDADNNKIDDYVSGEIFRIERNNKDPMRVSENKQIEKDDYVSGEIFPLKRRKNTVAQDAYKNKIKIDDDCDSGEIFHIERNNMGVLQISDNKQIERDDGYVTKERFHSKRHDKTVAQYGYNNKTVLDNDYVSGERFHFERNAEDARQDSDIKKSQSYDNYLCEKIFLFGRHVKNYPCDGDSDKIELSDDCVVDCGPLRNHNQTEGYSYFKATERKTAKPNLSEEIFHLELDEEDASQHIDNDQIELDDDYSVDRESLRYNEQQQAYSQAFYRTEKNVNLEQTKIAPKNFQLTKLLGKGSYGCVYLVRKITGPDSNKNFAMKVLNKSRFLENPKEAANTRSERKILAVVKHPFIVELAYSFQTHDKLYLVLEYLSGGDMFKLLQRRPIITENDARFYVSEITLALGYLHELGIIHRDLKPENIVLDEYGHIKLTDFGLSKERLQEGHVTYTKCGTLSYMAPEVLAGEGYGKSCDWWSLGVLIYRMMIGQWPFTGNDIEETIQNICTQNVSLPLYLKPELRDLIHRLLKRQESQRLGSGRDGATAVKSHAFFKDTNWNEVFARRLVPPFQPNSHDDNDVSQLSDECTNQFSVDSLCMPSLRSDLHFEGFSYEAPSFLGETPEPSCGQ